MRPKEREFFHPFDNGANTDPATAANIIFTMLKNHLRIAQVAPLDESVPPKYYGGTERVVSFLTEELVAQGHDVTLFASGDSTTSARLVSSTRESLRLTKNCEDKQAHHTLLLQLVQDQLHHFDIIHYHIDYLHFPLTRLNPVNHVTTVHGRLSVPVMEQLYRAFDEMPVVSISMAQRAPLPHLNWIGNVYHGLPEQRFEPSLSPGRYLAFLGRISPEKGIDKAIEIAVRCGLPLKIAAKIDSNDRPYYEHHIRKLLDHPLIEFVGEISDVEKGSFLSNAIGLLFPINWAEPFGLVMIESLACGTPVVAFRGGSVPEIIEHGRCGFIVDGTNQAVKAVQSIDLIDRKECRRVFETRFTARAMAQAYVDLYRRVVQEKHNSHDVKILQV